MISRNFRYLLVLKDGVSVGQLGIFVLLSYAAGHLIAALGNFGESLLWWACGGIPSEWVVKEKAKLLSDEQRELLLKKLQTRLGITLATVIGMDRKKWFPISRQIYADVERNGKRDRIETFNGNYGLNRGAGRRLPRPCVYRVRGRKLASGPQPLCLHHSLRLPGLPLRCALRS